MSLYKASVFPEPMSTKSGTAGTQPPYPLNVSPPDPTEEMDVKGELMENASPSASSTEMFSFSTSVSLFGNEDSCLNELLFRSS